MRDEIGRALARLSHGRATRHRPPLRSRPDRASDRRADRACRGHRQVTAPSLARTPPFRAGGRASRRGITTMNDTDIDQGLRDYYQSITPADSVRATNLAAASIRARRDRERGPRCFGTPADRNRHRGLIDRRDRCRGWLRGLAGRLRGGGLPGAAGRGWVHPRRRPHRQRRCKSEARHRPDRESDDSPFADAQAGHEFNALRQVQPDRLHGRPVRHGHPAPGWPGPDDRRLHPNDDRRLHRVDLLDLGRAVRPRDGQVRPDGLDGSGSRRRHRYPAEDGRVLFAGGIEFSDNGGQLASTSLATAQLVRPDDGEFGPPDRWASADRARPPRCWMTATS